MPKMKTSRSAAKRFSVTAKGKIRRNRAYANHILTKKQQDRKRRLRQSGLVDKTDARRIKRLIPYK